VDKSKAIAIIDKDSLQQKIDNFIQENQITKLNKDPTEEYQKQIKQTIKKCDAIIDKPTQKYLTNIKPTAPKLNAYIKTHKENHTIRPVVNYTQAPVYKTAKYLAKKLNTLIQLPYTYTTKNVQEIAEELKTINIDEHMKMTTLDIKDMYVNLPIPGILQTTKLWLNKNNNTETTTKQTLKLLETILKQNYFQSKDQIFQPNRGIAMGPPISGTIAELYTQHLEELYTKQLVEDKQIIYYKRYVDDILLIYNQQKTSTQEILRYVNSIDKHLQFKATEEINNQINFLDLSIHRHNNSIELGIFRKPTNTDITIHFTSNHPYEHKIAAYTHHINRMLTLPISKQAKQHEWETILKTARHNGYPTHIMENLKHKIKQRKRQKEKPQQHQQPTQSKTNKKYTCFTYHSPLIRKVTNLFKQTNLKIALRATNTTNQQLTEKQTQKNPSGIYRLKCNTCNKAYIGQSGRAINTRHKEHIRYIRTNNPTSAYATHILNTQHEYGNTDSTLKLLQPCRKGSKMNCWEAFYIQKYFQSNKLIGEQQANDPNPLFEIAVHSHNNLHTP
jgi:hypothetical protein